MEYAYVRKAVEGEFPEGAYPYLVIRVAEEAKQTYLDEAWESTDEQDWLDHSSEEVREAEAMADDVNSTEEVAE